jgi:hypothetical protein
MRKSPARDSYQALSSTAFGIGETRQCTAEPYSLPTQGLTFIEGQGSTCCLIHMKLCDL